MQGVNDVLQLEKNQVAQFSFLLVSMSKTDQNNQDTVEIQSRPVPSARAQQRYFLRQQENKLVVGDSRYIEPRTEFQLVFPAQPENTGLQLPARPLTQANTDWLTFLLLVALALFAAVRTSWNKYMAHLFHSAVNYTSSIRMFQEKNSSDLPGAFLLDLLFYLVFAAFAFQLLNFFGIDLPFRSFKLFLFSLGLIVAYFLMKKLIYRFLGYLIEKTSDTAEFIFNIDNFARVAGVVLFPVVTIIAFYPFSNPEVPVFSGIILVSVIYFLLIIRGFIILLNKQFPKFYLFLYFCTLEILPLVLLYKITVE